MNRNIGFVFIFPLFLTGCFGISYINSFERSSTTTPTSPSTPTPTPQKIVSKIVTGNSTCVIHDQGMDCWGVNGNGQLGVNGAAATVLTPLTVFSNQTIDSVVVGSSHTCVLINGGAKCVGSSSSGQLGQGNTTSSAVYVDVFPEQSGVTEIATNSLGSNCAVISGGLKCWGYNFYRQLGDGNTTQQNSPVEIFASGSGVTKIAMGFYMTCALVNTEVWCWGTNWNGQVGDGTTTNRSTPVKITSLGSGISDISAGSRHACVIKDGGLSCWGFNSNGQVGDNSITSRPSPVLIYPAGSGVSSVSLGVEHSCAIVNGNLDCWGSNVYGQMNDLVSFANKLVPTRILDASRNLTQLSSGDYNVCVVENNRKIICWGSANLGNGVIGNSVIWPDPEAVVGLTTNVEKLLKLQLLNDDGNYQNCSIVNGGVQCWGTNYNGILGNGTTSSSTSPVVAIPALSGATEVTAISGTNNASTCAVVDGGLQCWGAGYGVSPVSLIGAGSQVTSVELEQFDSFNYDYGCALVNGGVQCWGLNSTGQLGNGTTTTSATPVTAIAASSGVTKIELGLGTSCAIVSGGLKCWGYNDSGQIGDGSTTTRTSPTTIFANGSGVTDVAMTGDWHSAGGVTTCAVVDGGLQCWGRNAAGRVGDGTTTMRTTPVTIFPSSSGVTQVKASGYNTCIVKNSGLYCWGGNYNGSLGVGDTTSRNTPTLVIPEGSGVTAVDIGDYVGCAIINGGLKCWGTGAAVGEGTILDRLTPTDVFPAGSNVQEVRVVYGTVTCARLNNSQKCWGFDYGYGLVGNGRASRGSFSVEGY